MGANFFLHINHAKLIKMCKDHDPKTGTTKTLE